MSDNENIWTQRNITDEHRVDEQVDMYKALGFEVKVESFNPDESELECTECMKENPSQFKVIFTKGSGTGGEDLFDE